MRISKRLINNSKIFLADRDLMMFHKCNVFIPECDLETHIGCYYCKSRPIIKRNYKLFVIHGKRIYRIIKKYKLTFDS